MRDLLQNAINNLQNAQADFSQQMSSLTVDEINEALANEGYMDKYSDVPNFRHCNGRRNGLVQYCYEIPFTVDGKRGMARIFVWCENGRLFADY